MLTSPVLLGVRRVLDRLDLRHWTASHQANVRAVQDQVVEAVSRR